MRFFFYFFFLIWSSLLESCSSWGHQLAYAHVYILTVAAHFLLHEVMQPFLYNHNLGRVFSWSSESCQLEPDCALVHQTQHHGQAVILKNKFDSGDLNPSHTTTFCFTLQSSQVSTFIRSESIKMVLLHIVHNLSVLTSVMKKQSRKVYLIV